jgi:uncharacterized protein (TIGR03067 family)
MRTALLCLFAASLAVAAPVPKALKAKKTDAELLEGRWEYVTLDSGGGPRANTGAGLICNGTYYPGGDARKDNGLPIRLDQTKMPKQFDLEMSPGSILPGIYQIDGDTFTWCHNQPNQTRPTDFKGGNGCHSIVMKRVKE